VPEYCRCTPAEYRPFFKNPVSSTINTYNNGATNGNYETYYVGNYLAPANPPTANPIVSGGNPAAFRLYLQTDAGGAPVKPYLEQQLAQNRNFNGPNPAQVGVQTTYTVTVRLTNPTPYSITFSAANLVTANVPGGQVLYGGNGAVSQGSITATVVDVMPNGHLVVTGEKQIGVNQNVDVLRFSGTIDPRSIQAGSVVNSTQVANVRIESRGRGAQQEAQAMPWLGRFFMNVLPF